MNQGQREGAASMVMKYKEFEVLAQILESIILTRIHFLVLKFVILF